MGKCVFENYVKEKEKLKDKFRKIHKEILDLIRIDQDPYRRSIQREFQTRKYKSVVKQVFKRLFGFKGVWRNKAMMDNDETAMKVPTRAFNHVTSDFMKPILKPVLSQRLRYYSEEETEKMLKIEIIKDEEHDNWRMLKLD